MSFSEGPKVLPGAESARESIETESIASPPRGPFLNLRERWNGLARPVQWAWLLIVVAIAYALPYLNFFPLTTEPGNDWKLACFAMAVYALVAVGLNIVIAMASGSVHRYGIFASGESGLVNMAAV